MHLKEYNILFPEKLQSYIVGDYKPDQLTQFSLLTGWLAGRTVGLTTEEREREKNEN